MTEKAQTDKEQIIETLYEEHLNKEPEKYEKFFPEINMGFMSNEYIHFLRKLLTFYLQ